MKVYLPIILCLFLLSTSCKEENKASMQRFEQATLRKSKIHPFTKPIEKGHRVKAFLDQQVFQFDIDLDFGGEDRLDATVYMKTNSTGIRIDKTDGTSLVYDGQQVYMSPADADDKGARFDMFTWSYFFALPYKLNDPGTKWEDLGELPVRDALVRPAGRLSFDSGTGDAPDDWYVVYYNPENGLIDTAGYIVTFGGRDPKKAEANAHAIHYQNYQDTEGIPMATKWTFHNWNRETGLGEQLGSATLTHLKFSTRNDSIFARPKNSKEINM